MGALVLKKFITTVFYLKKKKIHYDCERIIHYFTISLLWQIPRKPFNLNSVCSIIWVLRLKTQQWLAPHLCHPKCLAIWSVGHDLNHYLNFQLNKIHWMARQPICIYLNTLQINLNFLNIETQVPAISSLPIHNPCMLDRQLTYWNENERLTNHKKRIF